MGDTLHLSKGQLIEMYKKMLLIRYFEEEVDRSVKRGLFHGTTHLCIGQEAVAVGVCSLLIDGDNITSTHRGHGHSIAMGADIYKMMAEIFGKVTGYCRGKGGSMHIADVESGNLGSNGIVGGGIPIAVGSALTAQLQGKDNVTVCFFGDGATNEGSFHEALNLASIWNLPVVFVCENNQYGMSSNISNMVNIDKLSKRSVSYGIPGVTIDGNNILDVITTTEEALLRARNGDGPTFIEANTYRYTGHSKSDKQLYRTEEEVREQKAKDPILHFEIYLKDSSVLSDDEIILLKSEIMDEVKRATTFAIESPEPKLTDLFTDVYA